MNSHRAESPPAPKEWIVLRSFSQRVAAWPDDDWSGITNPQQRRKLQNRLNQRAQRLRSKNQPAALAEGRKDEYFSYSSTSHQQHSLAALAHYGNEPKFEKAIDLDATSPILLGEIDKVHILELDSPATEATMQYLESIAHQAYTLGSPRTDLLLHLTQLNFTRALMENIRVLGLTSDKLHDDALSPFNTAGPWQYDLEHSLPPSLQPTTVQRCVPHHPWLDLLPVSQMRDNLILAGESFDETQLCLDMKGCGGVGTGRRGIIVWRDPWDPAGWEVTEAFACSWGWVIWHCGDLFQSTDHWRATRHEKPLFRRG